MYIKDFFQKVIRKANTAVLIYLVLNIALITVVVELLFGMAGDLPILWAFLIAIALYGVSITIALSPVGEAILRFQTGCKEIKRKDYKEVLYPIFENAYQRAKAKDPCIPNDVKLYMNSDKEPNAFATGRKTICVTEGLLTLTPKEIEAVLAHEFGHISHKDTDLILLVSVGNMIVSAIVITTRIVLELFRVVTLITSIFMGGSEGAIAILFTSIYNLLISLLLSGIMFIWTKLGILLVMKSSRENEYEADQFAAELGYAIKLASALDKIGGSETRGLFATLASTHPDKNDRVAKLQEYQMNI